MMQCNLGTRNFSMRLVFGILVTIILYIIVRQHQRILYFTRNGINLYVSGDTPILNKDNLPNNLPVTLMRSVYGDDRAVMTDLKPLDNIPKIFHFMWKDHRLPAQAAANLKEWRRFHPDWTFVFWTDADVAKLMDTTMATSTFRTMWKKLPQKIMRVDFVRYVILYLIGGVYADIDVRPKRPLYPVLRHHSCILTREPEIYALSFNHSSAFLASNFLMASRPGHPFWPILMDNMKNHKRGVVYWGTGAKAVNGAVRFYKETHNYVFRDASVFVAPSVYFEPPSNPKGHPFYYHRFKTLHCLLVKKAKATRPYMTHTCNRLRQKDIFDWEVQYHYPRYFSGSFTEHQKFNSFGKTFKTNFVSINDLSLKPVSPMKFLVIQKIIDIYEHDQKIMYRRDGNEIISNMP